MKLLSNLLGLRTQRNLIDRKSNHSRRRLFFEPLEDRRLLSVNPFYENEPMQVSMSEMIAQSEPVEGQTFIVTKDQSQTVFGVTYAIDSEETGSLLLTVGKYSAVSITNNTEGTNVTNISVSGTYNGPSDGHIIDETTASVTVAGEMPYYWKKANGNIEVTGNITKGIAGFTGTDVNITVKNGAVAQLGYRYVSKNIYYNIATTVTVEAGATVKGTGSFGNKTNTAVNVNGGTLEWAFNNQNSNSSGYVKSFSMSGGTMNLGNGTFTIDSITGGTVVCQSNTATYNFIKPVTDAKVTLKGFRSATFAGSVDELEVFGNSLEIGTDFTVNDLTVGTGGAVTLKGTATTMTMNGGYASIDSGAILGTLNIVAGTVVFPNGFTTGTSYVVSPGKGVIDLTSNTIYLNETNEVITTSVPAGDLTDHLVYSIDTNSGYYVISGTADVDTDTWTFKDGTEGQTGTTYGFYGTRSAALTLNPGASVFYGGTTFAPYTPDQEGTAEAVTFTFTPAVATILGIASISGSGNINLEGAAQAYAIIEEDDVLNVITTNQSKLFCDGLIYTRKGSPTERPVTISWKRLEIDGDLINSVILPENAGSTSDVTVVNNATGAVLQADTQEVICQSGLLHIHSDVDLVTVNGSSISSYITVAWVREDGNVTDAVLNNRATIHLGYVDGNGNKEGGYVETITLADDVVPDDDGNITLVGNASAGTVTLNPECYIRLEQGTTIGTLTLKAGSFLQSYISDSFVNANHAYTVTSNSNIAGTVLVDGSSTFTLFNKGDRITVNGINYYANKDYASVTVDSVGFVSLQDVDTEIRYNTRVTTLEDKVDAADGVISLREAINYATANIEWQGKQKSAFGGFEDYGYDFNTGKIVYKADMIAETLYYTPTGYDRSRESIEAAIVTFDASLDDGINDPKIMLKSELKYTKAFAVDGTVGTKTVILDRGLYEYNDTILDAPGNFETLCTDESSIKGQIWKRVEGKEDQYGRILNVDAAVPVELSNMTLQGAAGKTSIWGAAIYVKDADLSMTNVSIKGNYQENGDDFGIVWCEEGSIHMLGGSVEGNYVNGWGMFYAKKTDTLYFEDVLVTHNRATQGSFIESQYSENRIEIVNCDIIENKGNPIHMDTGDVDVIMSDTSFISNYESGRLYFINGDSTFTNCIFDNSKIKFTDIDYHLPVMRPYVGTEEKTNTQMYTNCLFNGMGFSIASPADGGHIDITLDHCTVTGCVNPMPPILTSNGITLTDNKYTLDLTLKDSILIGNDFDLKNNLKTQDKVNITVENSIIGRFQDANGTAEYDTTNSIIGEKKAGSMTFVQTDDPDSEGYYEVKTATVYMYDWDRELDLRSTVSGTSEEYSILGYNSFVYDEEDPDRKLDTTMNDLVFEGDEYYTTVTTAEDVVADDGVISLREAVAYASENIPDGATIQFSETLRDPETDVLSEIILESDLTINSPITMNGLVGSDRISISFDSTPEIKMINNAYLNLSDINLDRFGLYASKELEEGDTCVSGTASLYSFSGIDGGASVDAWLTVINGSTLSIEVFDNDDPQSQGTYVIHHVDSSGNPLHIKYNKEVITGYKIGDDGTLETDLLTLTPRSDPLYNWTFAKTEKVL